jgi:hypothetical protein
MKLVLVAAAVIAKVEGARVMVDLELSSFVIQFLQFHRVCLCQ